MSYLTKKSKKPTPIITLPSSSKLFNDLCVIIGVKNAFKFCALYGGKIKYIPKITTQIKDTRDKAIIEARSEGMRILDIVKVHGVSRATVMRILKRHKEDKCEK